MGGKQEGGFCQRMVGGCGSEGGGGLKWSLQHCKLDVVNPQPRVRRHGRADAECEASVSHCLRWLRLPALDPGHSNTIGVSLVDMAMYTRGGGCERQNEAPAHRRRHSALLVHHSKYMSCSGHSRPQSSLTGSLSLSEAVAVHAKIKIHPATAQTTRGYRGSRPPQPRDQSIHSTNKRRYF